MTRAPADLRNWALAYIEAQELSEPINSEHSLWWAIERTQIPGTQDQAEEVWAFVLEVLSLGPSAHVIGMVGGGPIEDLLDDWGENFIERIENAAKHTKIFRNMLRTVWQSGTPAVWARVQALQQEAGDNDA